jgi:hypothetical protein
MGFTKGSDTQGNVTFMKIKGMKKEYTKHYFEVGGEEIEGDKFSGTLIGALASSYEFEGQQKQTMKLTFIDNEREKYQLDIGYNSISRNFINSILGYIDTNKGKELNMELSLYIDKNGYKSLGLLINGERAKWLYSMEEQKALIDKITNKKGEFISTDYSAWDDKLKAGLENINKYVGGNKEEIKEKEGVDEF